MHGMESARSTGVMKSGVFTVIVLAFALEAGANPADPFSGSYTLDPARSDSIEKVIDEGIRGMNLFTRTIARRRLIKTNPPYERIALSFGTEVASITAGPSRLELPLRGAAVRWNRDGETITVTGRRSGDIYVETFHAKDGRRTNTFTPIEGGLRMDVTITASRLPRPLRYALIYRRVDQTSRTK